MGRIYPRSFIATRHYTSHPYSSDALYSVFSGRYPHGRRRLLAAADAVSFDGLMTGLAPSAPVRRVYVPSLYHIELDDRMYEAFGAELDVENGRYEMRQGLTGAVYASRHFGFDDSSQLHPTDPEARAVDDNLARLATLQQALVETLLRSPH